MRPEDLFDRDSEWADLEDLVHAPGPGLRVGILYGRRRLGKSFLLRRLCRAYGGIYHMALEEEPVPALQRFADSIASARGLPTGQLRFRDWPEALRAALSSPGEKSPNPRLLVIDELPYLLARPLGATIPSALQSLVDEARDAPGPPQRVIVCGSALSTMSQLMSGGKALRGRAQLDLLLRPFDFWTTADFYRIRDPAVALRLYAVLGGTPGYRDLIAEASPQTVGELNRLLQQTVLNPSHALFGEAAYLLREDPRISDQALYYSIVAAIAGGARSPSQVAAALGREQRSLAHPLDVLTTAGFVVKDDDLLLQRRPILRVADPIVRFQELVVAPRLAAFEDRRGERAWDDAQTTFRAQILGPAFEQLARDWTVRRAAASTLGGAVGEVGSTVVNDAGGRAAHELDVVALAPGQRRQARQPALRVLGEAKGSQRLRSLPDLARLDRIRTLLFARGVDAAQAKLLLFGLSGFDDTLQRVAVERDDVELVDLARIWQGD